MLNLKSPFFFFSLSGYLFSQNVMIVNDASGTANDTVTITVEIQNSDPFVGFQFDIPLGEQISFINGSATLLDRASDHQITASVLDGNILRVFAYSMTQSEFIGNSGDVCSFQVQLGTVPGDYPLNLQDAIIGNSNSENILTSVESGMATILALGINWYNNFLDNNQVPYEYFLSQNYPNPFNSKTTFEYSISKRSDVTIRLYNILGQVVHIHKMIAVRPGYYSYTWSGTNDIGRVVSSGVYIYRLETGGFVSTKKMVLMK